MFFYFDLGMPRFKYLGEPKRSYVADPGKCKQIQLPLKNGSKQVIKPPSGDHFVVGADIGADVTDQMALLTIRADSRFKEV